MYIYDRHSSYPLMTAAAPNSDGVLHNCNCYINSDGV